MPRKISLCLAGFGHAAQAFCRMLLQQESYLLKTHHAQVVVTAIATRSRGALIDSGGIDLRGALDEISEKGFLTPAHELQAKSDTLTCIRESGAQIFIELSTLSIDDGQPAISHIESALELGMHVITANKGPIAWDYHRLKSLADKQERQLLHETVVMDGTPVFNLVRKTLPGCQILSFKGILNSTTNFILEEMEKGRPYEEAVREAQRRGFAEADPSLDVDGWDAAAKTSALMNVLMNAHVTPLDIHRTGIGDITQKELQSAESKGCKIKLLCEGWVEDGHLRGKVYPALINRQDLFSTIDATSSILSLTTDLMGEMCIVERSPKIEQTAYGIYSDLLTLLNLDSE